MTQNDSSGDFYRSSEVYYDEDWNIDSVSRLYIYDEGQLLTYENDTLKEMLNRSSFSKYYYFYYNDSVQIFWDKTSGYYHVTSDFHGGDDKIDSIHIYNYDSVIVSTAYLTWDSENCTSIDNYSIYSDGTFNYYNDILNPYYNLHKYDRFGKYGSFNYVSNYTSIDTTYYEWVVINTINDYPVEVVQYTNGVHKNTIYYEYYMVTDINNNPIHEANILQIKYFNILGQEINKPKSGFYIEIIQTAQGI